MASAWITKRPRKGGGATWRVLYRVGGREATPRHGGSFRTQRQAETRQRWIEDELAAMRVPNLRLIAPQGPRTFREVAEQWRTSRRDVSEGTRATHAVNLARLLPTLEHLAVDEISVANVDALVGDLSARGLARESVRKTLGTLAMVLDWARVTPNPARDRDRVKLPERKYEQVNPPTAEHLVSIYGLLRRPYRLPALVLDATGMRVGELQALTWGDVDEPAGRWRVTAATAKTRRPRWISVPDAVFEAVTELVPREDRDLGGPVFAGFGADRFRTALTRACRAAGRPLISPHDFRHRRASLMHLGGMSVAVACAHLGHSPQVHLELYAHVMLDRAELDYATILLGDVRPGAYRGDTARIGIGL